jgi:hypothetical protein
MTHFPNATPRQRPSGDLVGFGQSYTQATARRQLRASLALVALFAAATAAAAAMASYEALRSDAIGDRAIAPVAFTGKLPPASPVSFAGALPAVR